MEILAISYTSGLSSAYLGHGLRDRLPDFYVQVSSTNLITMSVPPAMEQPIIKKYKLKKDGRPAKTPLFLGHNCENNIQLLDMVDFIKGWTKFARKSQMVINDTIVFNPMDNDFDFRLYREGSSVEVIWGCKKHRSGPWIDPNYKAPPRNRRQ
jgi:hypothetical protein